VSRYDEEEIEVMVQDCLARYSSMSEWEKQFIYDVQERLTDGKDLSGGQAAKVTEVWEEVTSRQSGGRRQ